MTTASPMTPAMDPPAARGYQEEKQRELGRPAAQEQVQQQVQQQGDREVSALLAELEMVWAEFVREFEATPIMARILGCRASLADYQLLLLNLRQQVIEGGCWLARAASQMEIGHFELRSAFIRHAATEHRDYLMLEDDYVQAGGRLVEIRSAPKNIGSEALSAWIYQLSSQPNPFGVLGALFIIEGVGSRLAARLAEQLRLGLGLRPEQLKFIAYHAEQDGGHQGEMRRLLGSGFLDATVRARIVKCARVTGLLYALQFQTLGRY